MMSSTIILLDKPRDDEEEKSRATRIVELRMVVAPRGTVERKMVWYYYSTVLLQLFIL